MTDSRTLGAKRAWKRLSTRAGWRQVASAVMGALLLAAVVASSALAEGDESKEAVPAVLTPQLIQEASTSPNAFSLEEPATDAQAAHELPRDELDRNEALHLLSSVFAAEIESPGGLFDEMPQARFLSDHAAVMQAGSVAEAMTGAEELSGPKAQEPTLIESSVPLRAEDAEGNQAPVDLSLERSEGELQPANPIVETGIPTELGEGISLANGDVELSFPEASEERSASTVEGDAAFYPNVQEDSDLLVAPVSGGVETMTQLRTAQAPRTQIIHVTLPEGAHLEETKQGGVEATLNGRLLLNMAPPSAVDAAGDVVPITVGVSGDNVELTISPSGDSVYPILADPAWTTENYNWTWGGSTTAGWSAVNLVSSYMALPYQFPNSQFNALDDTSGFPGGATPNTGAQWQYSVPRYASDLTKYGVAPESFISSVFTEGMMFLLEGNHATWPALVAGIIDTEHAEWASVTVHSGAEGEITGWTGHSNFFNFYEPNPIAGPGHTNEDTHARQFVFGLITLENEAQAKYRNAVAGTATTAISDHNTPLIGSASGGTAWWNGGEPRIEYATSDAGLGVTSLELVPPGKSINAFGQGNSPEFAVGCTGTVTSPCPRQVNSAEVGSPKVAVNAATAPEGIDRYTLAAFDPLWSSGFSEGSVSHVAERTVTLHVDRTAPTLSLSGSLTEQASLGTAKPQYTLNYQAADGIEELPTIAASYGTEGAGGAQFKHPADVSRDVAGNLWVADENNNRIEKLNENGGFLAAYSSVGATEQLNHPTGIEVDPSGNVWVVDSGNNRLVEFNSKGEWIRKVGHGGSGNSEFSAPQGISVGSNGNVWVADTGNNRVQEFSSTGAFIRAFGSKGAGNGLLSEPTSVDVGPGGKIWVADAGNNRIEEFSEQGEFLAAYGSLGSGNGQLSHPDAIQVDSRGSVWVADQNNGRIEQFSERGEYLGQFGAKGTGPGQLTLSGPTGLTTSAAGALWVVDPGDNRVETWNAPQGTRSGTRSVVLKMDGKVVQEPTITCLQGGCPLGGTWMLHSGEYSAGTHTVEVIATDGVGLSRTEKRTITLNPPAPSLTLSGTLTEQGSLGTAHPHYALKLSASAEEGSGVSQAGQSAIATQITIDGKQVDSGEASCATETCPITREWTLNSGEYSAGTHTVIAKATDRYGRSTTKELKITLEPPAPSVTLSGTMTEQASLGTTRPHYTLKLNAAAEEGTGAAPTYVSFFGSTGTGNGQFSHPAGIAIDAAGNLWVADMEHSRIEEFNSAGGYVKSVGSPGTGNGQFSRPKSIAIDPKGNFWVADAGNNRLEEFNPSWEFMKAVGSAGSGNGQFNGPEGIAIDAKGNVWVADTYNHRVQELNEKGEFIKVIAGLGSIEPTGLAVGPGGNVWIADWAGDRVVEVSEGGALLRSFGSQGAGNGQFKQPDVVAIDPAGNVMVGDQNNERIQEFNQSGEYLAQFGTAGSGAGQFSFGYPMSIATDSQGNIWASDTGNNRVQRWHLPVRSTIATEITIDGKRVDSGEASCSTESCPITREWTLNAGEYVAGPHTVVAKATDRYGYWTSKIRTIEIQPDKVKPTLQTGGELANAPEGWVQQETYKLTASATDPAGYGVTSLAFRIDGSTVASTTKSCPEGGCETSLSKEVNMAPYSGGSHEAEVIATDGAGNTTTKPWTINVDPEGHVTTAEATATMEAVEETSESNLVGESAEEQGIEGTGPGLGLESTETGLVATGSAAPVTFGIDPGDAMTVEVPEAAELFGCPAETEEPSGPEEPCVPASEAGDGELQTVAVTPLGVQGSAGSGSLVEENAAVAADTESATDTVFRPLNDGGMIFQAIRDDSAPETYAYGVVLDEEQELRQIDETHVEVYYATGIPAFTITAEPASDAVGTAVPTTLQKTAENVVTLTVHYRAGQNGTPFVFPVVGGTGWEGGFRTEYVNIEGFGPPEEGSEEEEEEGESLHARAFRFGPPIARPDKKPPNGFNEYKGITTMERTYVFEACRRDPSQSGIPSPPPHPRMNDVSEPHGCVALYHENYWRLDWAVEMNGAFSYKPGQVVWIEHGPTCPPPWGPDATRLPTGKGCEATKPASAGGGGHIDILGDWRFKPDQFAAGRAPLLEMCFTDDGVLPVNPGGNPQTKFWGIDHEYVHPVEHIGDNCPWGEF